MTLDEIRARLDEIEAERYSIHQDAGECALNEDQQKRWDDLDVEERELREQLAELERRERVAESRKKWATLQVGSRVERGLRGDDVTRLDARAAVDRARAVLGSDGDAGHVPDEARARLERLLKTRNDNTDGVYLARRLLVTEDPDYREAFLRLVTRNSPTLSPEQVAAVHRYEEFRAMSIGTPASGGYGVPVELAA